MTIHRKIIAVDFDGCIVSNKSPEIGELIPETVARVKAEKEKGSRLILWTCRRDELLCAAIEFCTAHGIYFEAINENLPDIIEAFGGDTRKIFANEYWDDRAVLMPPSDHLLFLPFATTGSMTISAGHTTVEGRNGDASVQLTGKVCIIECTKEESDRYDRAADAAMGAGSS